MRIRSHRRSLMAWSPPSATRAGRYGVLAFGQAARPRRVRWWFRTGTLLAVIGLTRLARNMRTHWRPVFVITGTALVIIGTMLPSGAAFVPGLLVLLVALLKQAEPSHCRAAAQMTDVRWRG